MTAMSRTLLTLVAALALGCSTNPSPSDSRGETATKPNVVMIIADDQGAPYSGFMGADYVHTPNLDALAAGGTVFTDGYVPANHCRPSLRTLLTGLLPVQAETIQAALQDSLSRSPRILAMSQEQQTEWRDTFDFHAFRYFDTLTKALGDAGYLSFQGGKWWEYTYENGHFTHGMTTGWSEDERDDPDWFKEFMGGDGLDLARVTNQAAYDFIDDAGDQPFFMWYAPELPHYPFTAPEPYQEIYADADLTESAKLYYANISWFDDQVGQLIDFLRRRGTLDNTLLVFVNDNGWEQEPDQEFVGDEMRFHNGGDRGKLSMYDQSFRTPIIFSWPGHIKAGARHSDLVHSADIPLTILDYLGVDGLPYAYGRSVRPVIEGRAGGRDAIQGRATQVRWEGDMMGRSTQGYWLREGPWYFSWDLPTDETRLFNLETDPRSDTNVADREPVRVSDYRRRVEAWRQEFESSNS